MMAPGDFDAAALRLALGFAAQVRRWAREQGASDASADAASSAAQAVSLATSAGHTCVMLDEAFAGAATPALRATLLESGVVGTPQAPGALPLVLDADGRLYLHRYFEHERRLSERLLAAARRPMAPPDAGMAGRLAALFPGRDAGAGTRRRTRPDDGRPDWQRVAAALALGRRLAVISGGPGTGKTTTVVNVLACLLAQQPGCRIALAAPTGKAAARMMEAIRARAAGLPAEVRERLPAEARTIHRLLGASPRGDDFRHHAGHRLPIDVLVVDEASMLDLALAAQLMDAVPDEARIVLLGDKDQLAAVEAGAVFAELSADPSLDAATRGWLGPLCGVAPSALVPPEAGVRSPLANTTVWLTETHRFTEDSGIGALAQAINAGDAARVLALLADTRPPQPNPALRRIDDDRALGTLLLDGYAAYVDALCKRRADAASVARAFDAFRVLCAVRDGPRGVHALNRRCEQHVRAAVAAARIGRADAASPWYAGRPVIVTRNDPLLRLFNGDVGIALPDANGTLQVHFPDGAGGWRALAPARLPEHESAYAITVHRSQGSEFDRVAVVLPDARSPVATRELLYTAVTRARTQVTLCASAAMVEHAVRQATARRSGLLARLREAAG